MAQTVIVKMTDDIDGGEADETISFALNGKTYEIDLSAKNAEKLRNAFAPFIEKGRKTSRAESGSRAHAGTTSAGKGSKTLFSGLDADEKVRFRAWADMPTARRVGDVKVQEWIDAGRP
jgi:Lsr2